MFLILPHVVTIYIGDTICSQFKREGIVCPSLLHKNIFSTHATDNIDHDPSSRSSRDSFHGTAVTATQHLLKVNDGQIRPPLPSARSSGLQLEKLPSDYTTVQPFVLAKKDVYIKAQDIL